MKKNTLIILFALVSFISNAQLITTKKNGGEKQADYIFATAGVSLPVGLINTPKYSGVLASPGPLLTLGCHHFYNKRWGMGLSLSSSIYNGKPNYKVSDNYSTNGSWHKGQLYINASYTVILKDRLAIDIVQGIGIYYMKEPSYQYTSLNREYSIKERKGWNTTYNIGIKSRFLLKENIGVLFSANYSYALDLLSRSIDSFNSVECELGFFVKLKK